MFDSNGIINPEKICRACLFKKPNKELKSLFEDNLEKLLREIASIQLEFNSFLPSCICIQCIDILNSAFNFRLQVQASEAHLQALINKDHTDDTTVVYKAFTLQKEGYTDDSGIDVNDSDRKYNSYCKDGLIDDIQNALSVQESNKNKKDTVPINSVIDKQSDECLGCNVDILSNNVENNHKISALPESSCNVIKWAESDNRVLSEQTENIRDTTQYKNVTLDPDVYISTENKESETDIQSNINNNNDEFATKIKRSIAVDNFKCTFCIKSFRYDSVYKVHLLKHGVPLVCGICQIRFKELNHFTSHIKSSHPDYKPFSCPNCPKKFNIISTLKKHSIIHNSKKKLECNICGKYFYQKATLIVHERSHSGEKPYECNTCKKFFVDLHGLRNHKKIHTGEKKHECFTCGASFIHGFSLKAHARTHSGEKPYVCKLCNNKFSTSSYLKIHMRTHTSEKPYECNFCSKNFVSKCALVAHIKIHTGEKYFQCDTCGQRSTRLADLRTHMRSHSGEKPYACEQCGKRYKTSSNLAVHKKTHLGLKEHICTICQKAFGDPRTLKSHIRIHTGETPYQCNICGNRFKQSGQLSVHKKNHQIQYEME